MSEDAPATVRLIDAVQSFGRSLEKAGRDLDALKAELAKPAGENPRPVDKPLEKPQLRVLRCDYGD